MGNWVGYFCMGQMMQDEVVVYIFHGMYPISFANMFNFVNYQIK
jgi:hypothetical protein